MRILGIKHRSSARATNAPGCWANPPVPWILICMLGKIFQEFFWDFYQLTGYIKAHYSLSRFFLLWIYGLILLCSKKQFTWLFKCKLNGFSKQVLYFGKYSLSAWEECLLWLLESMSHKCQVDWQCCSGLVMAINFLFELSVIVREKLAFQTTIVSLSFSVFHFVRVSLMHFAVLLICVYMARLLCLLGCLTLLLLCNCFADSSPM